MNEKPDYTYKDALRSFDGAPDGNVSGGLTLFRVILKIGLAEGIPIEKIAEDVSRRLRLSREEVADRLAKCQPPKPKLYSVKPAQSNLADRSS